MGANLASEFVINFRISNNGKPPTEGAERGRNSNLDLCRNKTTEHFDKDVVGNVNS